MSSPRRPAAKEWPGVLAKAKATIYQIESYDPGGMFGEPTHAPLYLPQPIKVSTGLWGTDKELRPAHGADFYPTDSKIPYPALSQMAPDAPSVVLDIGAGAGPWGAAARRLWPQAIIVGVELRNVASPDHHNLDPTLPTFDPDYPPPTLPSVGRYAKAPWYDAWITGSILDPLVVAQLRQVAPAGFDLIIGNPPFGIAQEIIALAWAELMTPGGHMLMLLRGAFLESIERMDSLWAAHHCPLEKFWVFSKRPSFTEDGRTDATMYAMFRWHRAKRTREWAGDFFDYSDYTDRRTAGGQQLMEGL